MPHQIFLVEDHPIMRRAYADVLAREADLELSGVSASAEEALTELEGAECDLLITDLSLPGMDGISLTERIHTERPGLPIVVISAHNEPVIAERARAAGARAYLRKDGLALSLPDALREVLRGGSRFEPEADGANGADSNL